MFPWGKHVRPSVRTDMRRHRLCTGTAYGLYLHLSGSLLRGKLRRVPRVSPSRSFPVILGGMGERDPAAETFENRGCARSGGRGHRGAPGRPLRKHVRPSGQHLRPTEEKWREICWRTAVRLAGNAGKGRAGPCCPARSLRPGAGEVWQRLATEREMQDRCRTRRGGAVTTRGQHVVRFSRPDEDVLGQLRV